MDSGLLGLSLSYILLYKYIALYGLMFLAGFIVPIPSNALLIVVGVFSSQGYIDFSASLAVAILGNVSGACFGYWLTHHYGDRVFRRLLSKKSSRLDRLNGYIKKSAGWTILITRFSNAVGMIVNFLCGLTHIPFGKFLLFDAIGNFFNITTMVVLGFFIGIYWEKASDIVNTIGIVLTVALVAFAAFKLFAQKKA